jgi:hypothetical protein
VERGLKRDVSRTPGTTLYQGLPPSMSNGVWSSLLTFHGVRGIRAGTGLSQFRVPGMLHEVDARLGAARGHRPGRRQIVLESRMEDLARSARAQRALHILGCNKVRNVSALDLSAAYLIGPESRDELRAASQRARFPQPELHEPLALEIRILNTAWRECTPRSE